MLRYFACAFLPLMASAAMAMCPITMPDSIAMSHGHNLHRNTSNRTVVVDHSASLLAESFEDCTLLSDELPQGWSRVTNITSTHSVDHWFAMSRSYAASSDYPAPADGNMMMVMTYDDSNKDEMLISPTVSIPAEGGYELSYYWYTVPAFVYVIDRYHVDYEAEEFILREVAFDFEVKVRVDGGDWQRIYSLEQDLSELSYGELSQIRYSDMQQHVINLDDFAGHDVQIGLRYHGTDGNTFIVDAVTVSKPAPEVYYMPDVSRLFFGISTDGDMSWMPASIEFVPVGYPVTWTNESNNDGQVDYWWTYHNLDSDGQLVPFTSRDQNRLQVTYHPDYASAGALTNNFYYMPSLTAKSANGASATYTCQSDFLQAGGTPEFDFEGNTGYMKLTAFSFDVINERIGMHVETDDELGFLAEPIFGYSVNHDKWWEHHSYPGGNLSGRYSYVDGFANLILPHEQAPMVVYGASAMAYGTIYPEAEFFCKIYRVDSNGNVNPTPMTQTSIRGRDVIEGVSGITRKYLTLNFTFDQPVVFSSTDTSYGYLVEVSGYHDPKIEFFAPLQSLVPNEYEWCLGFYHHYWPYHDSLSDEMSYVAGFTNDYGQPLFSAFAIGLDAHYPWLEAADGNYDITIEGDAGVATTMLHGYFAAEAYSIEAPQWLAVDLKGRYSTTATMTVTEPAETDRTAQVTISAPGVNRTFSVTAKAAAGAIIVNPDRQTGRVYNLQGITVMEHATADDVRQLPAGVYILNGSKIIVP